jgi:hypothetical protein
MIRRPQASQLAAVKAISGHVANLGTALAAWHARDDAGPCPDARRAANVAMEVIDAALAGLHAVRQQLVSEIRTSDDLAAAHVDRLL